MKNFNINQVIKRILDILISFTALLFLSPLFLLLAFLVYSSTPGAIFYIQTRVGKKGENYKIYKFRSMYKDSEKNTGPIWASNEDKRITPLGRIMRKFHLDEIPQFFNVLILS